MKKKIKQPIYSYDKDGYFLENGKRISTATPEFANKKEIKMLTIQVQEGSLIVPPGMILKWAKQILFDEQIKTNTLLNQTK